MTKEEDIYQFEKPIVVLDLLSSNMLIAAGKSRSSTGAKLLCTWE